MEDFKSVGIIGEYNPFHNGHLLQLRESRRRTEAEAVVSVISGNFTQRGEIAIADKWTRAEMAVRNGADLVVEMPVIFACNSAGYFAEMGVEILENLGVDWISFGSEDGDMEALGVLAKKLDDSREKVDRQIRTAVKAGLSYPRARQESLEAVLSEAEVDMLGKPNTILALEYLKNIKTAQPMTVKRQGPGYHEEGSQGNLASATWIRNQLEQGLDVSRFLPCASASMLLASQNMGDLAEEMKQAKQNLFLMVCQKILTMSAQELEEIAAGGEGLGNKAKNQIRYCTGWEELVESLKTKRYTRTRINRFLIQILLGITREKVEQGKPYIRVLAFNEAGGGYLKAVKKAGCCRLPIITNINRELACRPEFFQTAMMDVSAGDMYNLAKGRNLYNHCDLVEKVRQMT